jgi:hypothetical protein
MRARAVQLGLDAVTTASVVVYFLALPTTLSLALSRASTCLGRPDCLELPLYTS